MMELVLDTQNTNHLLFSFPSINYESSDNKETYFELFAPGRIEMKYRIFVLTR